MGLGPLQAVGSTQLLPFNHMRVRVETRHCIAILTRGMMDARGRGVLNRLVVGGLMVMAVAFFAFCPFGDGKAEAQMSSPAPTPVMIGPGHLSEQDFWALIDHSAVLEADPNAQLAELRASLDRLKPDQIAEFEQIFDQTMRQSYSWDLWGAAYLANGGASDDGFEYFRCWLISKGRAAFEMVAADPDKLAGLLAPESEGEFEFEEFAYVARGAWAAKTGRDWNDMPLVANMMYDAKPSGLAFSENPAELAKRYPRLWERFGRK